MGGTVVARGSKKGAYVARYPTRSFMYEAVKRLKSKGKIAPRFSVTLKRNW
jgi:hypothetical protein